MSEQSQERHDETRTFAEEGARYASLTDYIRVLRRHRVMIVLFTLGFGVLALGISLSQSKTYEAASQVTFRDPLAGLTILTDSTPQESPVVRSAAQADLVTRPEVSRRVQKKLKTDLSPSDLASSVDTSVGVQTNIVSILVSSGDAEFAADVANAYATVVRNVGSKEALGIVDRAISGLEQEIKAVRAEDLEPSIELLRLSPLQQQLAQVEIVRRASEPVEIVNRASVPGGAVSPSPRRNTVLGLLLGLVVGLIAAFVRDALDRRVHNAQQVHDDLGLPILGRVADSAMGFPGLAGNGSFPMIDQDFEAFRALRMNIAALGEEGRPPRTILVTSAMSEEGKSTVSMSLASAAAIAGQRVLLVECDLRRPSFARRLGITREPGLSDYLLGNAGPKEVLRVVDLKPPGGVNGGAKAVAPAGKMVVIPAGTQVSNPAELLIAPRFHAFLEQVAKAYDLVVLDSSPMLAVVDSLELAPRVDGTLVCVRVRRTTRDQVRAARAAIRHLAHRPMGAVVTGIKRGDADSYDYYYGY